MREETCARVAAALSTPGRVRIVELLAGGERSVEEIAQASRLSFANTSRHLQILRQSGLVEARRDGRHVRCRLTSSNIASLIQLLEELGERRRPSAKPPESSKPASSAAPLPPEPQEIDRGRIAGARSLPPEED